MKAHPAKILTLLAAGALSLLQVGAAGEEKKLVPYDGRCAAPCPPEAIAHLLDELIAKGADGVTLTLVCHPKPSTQPADTRTSWVCLSGEKPRWALSSAPEKIEVRKVDSITARALHQARRFLAEREELKGKERLADWQPAKETLQPTYQSKEYGLQITEIKLLDRKTERWAITAKPIEDSLGGEVWLRFERDSAVSAEYGR